MNKARVVLDSNVLLSGLKSDLGNSYKVLQALGSGLFEIALSVPLVLEYESILKNILIGLSIRTNVLRRFLTQFVRLVSRRKYFFSGGQFFLTDLMITFWRLQWPVNVILS